MNYSSSLQYLNSFLNLEQMQLTSSASMGLGRMKKLLAWAGHPEKAFFPLLIAGTKGKGSTGFFLEAILRAAKIPVGFYVSPHLEDPRERIRINGQWISKALWTQGLGRIKQMLLKRGISSGRETFTYFEIMTLLALLAFKRQGVAVAILEVGMGGRLDATNAVSHQLEIITPIHLDHEAVLGPTIARIAKEKAAIIWPGSSVVVSPQVSEAMKVIQKAIRTNRAWHTLTTPLIKKAGLSGEHQRVNASAAVRAAEILRDRFGFSIPERALAQGILRKDWPGRFERFLMPGGREFILDGAHNPISVKALVRTLEGLYPKRPRRLIFGTSRDKNAQEMLKALSRYFPEIILTRAQNPRSSEVGTLLEHSRGLFQRIYPFARAAEAMEFSQQDFPSKGIVVITGSFYLAGEARKLMKGRNGERGIGRR